MRRTLSHVLKITGDTAGSAGYARRPWTSNACSARTGSGCGTPTRRCPPSCRRCRSPPPKGCRLRLADGRELVDGMSSWWAAVHGYGHPVLDAAIRDQLGAMSHVMFGGLTHAPAVDLARTLVEITPAGLGARVLRRLGLGVGGGRDQDVPPVPAFAGPCGQAPADDVARRLPRRHLRRDERVRPRRRDARALARRAAAAGVRERAAVGVRARLRRGAGEAGRGARRRAGRGDRRAGRAGRGRHALPRPALPARAAGADAGPRRAAGVRRDRHRVRAHGRAVRGRPRSRSRRTSCASARR